MKFFLILKDREHKKGVTGLHIVGQFTSLSAAVLAKARADRDNPEMTFYLSAVIE